MLTPKRLAAALRDSPPKTTASTTRLRRSSESAIPAASFARPGSSIRTQAIRESPSRFRPFGYRSNLLSNLAFETYEDIIDAACDAWRKLIDQPQTIISIGTRDWTHTH